MTMMKPSTIAVAITILAQSANAFVIPTRVTRTAPTLLAATSADASFDEVCDVLVLGSGPGGRAMASLLAASEHDVVLADRNFDREWAPTYGGWKDEWESILAKYQAAGVTLQRTVDREWKVTDCFFGGSFDKPMDECLRLDRPYLRLDKHAVADMLTSGYKVLEANHFSEAIGVNMYEPAGSLVHDRDGTTIQLKDKDDAVVTVRTKIVIDTTGHETKLVLRDGRDQYTSPGFQIAYGAIMEVDESDVPSSSKFGPYDKEAMTLFDYRTDHFDTPESEQRAIQTPTFNYVMPLGGNKIFSEETSLVARPGVSFQECKDRLNKRLEFHGIKPINVLEEEYCYIPMGGALPQRDQRVLAFAGASAMAHPSTGFHICRALMGATFVAEAIQQGLAADDGSIDRTVASAYHAMWSPEAIRQRNFATYGGEYLMKQDVVGLRGFFTGFFRLPVELWGGFLAGWRGLPYNEEHETWYNRLWFGLNFIVRIPPQVALDMALSIVTYSIEEGVPLPQAVTPFFGEPKSYEYAPNNDRVGDVAAKTEAMKMIGESKSLPLEAPVALGEK